MYTCHNKIENSKLAKLWFKQQKTVKDKQNINQTDVHVWIVVFNVEERLVPEYKTLLLYFLSLCNQGLPSFDVDCCTSMTQLV